MAIEWGRGKGEGENLSNSASLSATTNRTKASLAFPTIYTPVHTLIHQSIKIPRMLYCSRTLKTVRYTSTPTPYLRILDLSKFYLSQQGREVSLFPPSEGNESSRCTKCGC